MSVGCVTCGGGLGSDGAPINNTTLLEDANELFSTGDFVLVDYAGASYPHPVGSPTNTLSTKYGYTRYSIHTQKGRALLVLSVDVAARPDLFIVIPEDTERHGAVCEQFGIDPNYSPVQVVTEVPLLDAELKVVESVDDTDGSAEGSSQDDEVPTFPILTQETAMTLKDFTNNHPDFTHHLQVLAQVKQGNFQSEKRDDVIYVWHT